MRRDARGMKTLWQSMCAMVVAAIVATFVVTTGTASAAVAQGAVLPAATPDARTPHVLDNKVLDLAEVGNRIVVVGDFTRAQDAPANGSAAWNQRSVLAFDRATGAIDRSFRVQLDGLVNAVEPGPDGTVFLGGTFSTVNGAVSRNLARVSLATGARVATFAPSGINGAVNDLAFSGGRLFVGGVFNAVQGAAHGGLATVDPNTAAVDPYMGVDVLGNHNYPRGTARAAVGVRDLALSPDGSRLVAIGNFTRADGLIRDQVVSVLLQPGSALVDPNWRTTRYEPACYANGFDSYVREVDYAPDGSHFVIVATGGSGYLGTLCDAAARFDSSSTGQAVEPRWVAVTGGDTLHSVAASDAVTYIGGHQRWLNNPLGVDAAKAGAVPRPGIAALDARTGMPLAWNPGRNPRGIGAEALLTTASGLYVGMDTPYFGNYTHLRPRLGHFPLAGGYALPKEVTGKLPSDVFLAGRSPGSRLPVNGALSRFFDGTRAAADVPLAADGTRWDLVRGAFVVDGTLYYGHPGTGGVYHLFRRSFDGKTLGRASQIDPYNDPVWSNVSVGSRNGVSYGTYRGALPSFYHGLSGVSGMAYSDGRLYFTRSNDPGLYYRYFSVDSGVVSEDRFVAGNTGVANPGGVFLSGEQLYVVNAANGDLTRTKLANGVLSGAPVVVSGPAKDGRDWRASAVFLGPRANQAPTAQFTAECVDLTCSFDAGASTDADGSISEWRWDFGNGATTTGARTTHSFSAGGSYQVTLTATDDNRASATSTQTVQVAAPPTGTTGIALRGSAGTTARPVTAVSVDVPESVRAGDGLVLVLSTNSAATGTAPAGWTSAGEQRAATAMTTQVFSRVASAEDAGSTVTVPLNQSAAVSLQVLAYSGTATSGPVASVTGATNGSGTSHTTPTADAAAGSMVVSVWSDKGPSARRFVAPAGVTERSNLAGSGTGDVATLVADNGPVPAGRVGGLTATVPVASSRATMLTVVLAPGTASPAPVTDTPAPANQAPEAVISSTCAGLTCSFDGSGSTDTDGSVASYAWDFGDGTTSTQAKAEHTYAAAGEYTVGLTVTDGAGATGTSTATVTVAAAPVAAGIGLRGSAGTAARPVTAVSVDVPAAVRAGDGLVLVLSTNSAATGTAPAGWQLEGTQTDGGKMTTQVFSRPAGASDAGSRVTVGLPVTSAVTLQLMAYSGTTSDPVASVTGAAGGAATSHTTPTATAPAGAWVLSVWSDKASTERAFVPPAELTERSNIAGAGNGDVATLVADSGTAVAAGQVGGLTATVPTASSRATMLTVVLTPAG